MLVFSSIFLRMCRSYLRFHQGSIHGSVSERTATSSVTGEKNEKQEKIRKSNVCARFVPSFFFSGVTFCPCPPSKFLFLENPTSFSTPDSPSRCTVLSLAATAGQCQVLRQRGSAVRMPSVAKRKNETQRATRKSISRVLEKKNTSPVSPLFPNRIGLSQMMWKQPLLSSFNSSQ